MAITMRLRGGASSSATQKGSFSIKLVENSLQIVDNMYPQQLTGPPLLDGIPDAFTEKATSTGGLFLSAAFFSAQAEHDTCLGSLHCSRFLAGTRVTRYWMGPAFGQRGCDIPHETQFLLLEVERDQKYALLLPLVDQASGMRATIHGGKNKDGLILHIESGDGSIATNFVENALYLAAGPEPFELLRRGFREVAAALGTFKVREQKPLPSNLDAFGWCTWDAFYSKVEPRGILSGLESLRAAGVPPRTLIIDDGWQTVAPPADTDPKVQTANSVDDKRTMNKALAVMHAAATAVVAWMGSLVLGVVAAVFEAYYERFVKRAQHDSIAARIWRALTSTVLKGQLYTYFDTQTDFGRQLSSFQPNEKFEAPGSESGSSKTLASLVGEAKELYGVQRVFCWHALHGYWRGADSALGEAHNIPITQAMPRPSRHLLKLEPQVAWDTPALFGVGLVTRENHATRFYAALHAPLVASGVDGVKVDVQSGVGAMGGGVGGGPYLAGIYTRAMEASVAKNFGSNCINCMCHSTENLFHYAETNLARASDDFYPSRPNSHTVHLVNVAYNSVFLGEICVPDWDMFHSLHEVAGLHAAARAVGGCPVYVSDRPGQHDVPLLRRLVLPDGTVLRARLPGRPSRDSLFSDVGRDGVSALKIWNANEVGGVVGAFNVQGVAWDFRTRENVQVAPLPAAPVSAEVRPSDIETLRDHPGPFAAWRHRGNRAEVVPDAGTPIHVHLDSREWEVLTVMPVQQLAKPMPVEWAPLGLGDMLNGGGALKDAGELSAAMLGGVPAMPINTKVICRAPGRFVAYCKPGPTRVMRRALDGDGNDESTNLDFTYDAKTGKLETLLPDGTAELAVVWE